MRKEIENWWKQAQEDFDAAKYNFQGKKYYLVAFLCQQTIEKALKAAIIFKTGEKNIEGHSLIYLGKYAKIPSEFFPDLKKVSPQYFISRYPDLTEETPYELYDKEIVEEFIETAERVLSWTKKQLKL